MSEATDVKYQLQEYQPNLSVSTRENIQNIITGIEQNDKPLYGQALINFVVKENEQFNIEELKEHGLRAKLWNSLTKLATGANDNDLLAIVFTVFRIISRDKGSVNDLVNDEWISLILKNIGLNDNEFNYDEDTLCRIEEGQKVLWNTVFSSKPLVEASLSNGLLDKLVNRIRLYDSAHISDVIKFYDVKLLFLLSALSVPVREKLEKELDGLNVLINVLRVVLKEAAESIAQSPELPAILDDKKAEVVCETLKCMFNITLKCGTDSKSIQQYNILIGLLRNYLLASTITLERTWDLRNDIINLLTNIPAVCYSELMMPVDKSKPLLKSLKFENYNMIVFYEMLMFLEAKFNDKVALSVTQQLEVYSPILTVLLKGTTAHRPIRKYLRLHILPPLKDVDNRPENTDTLRGKLCKLLTTPITQIRDLVAELLFVLCKCNVDRMIKYTGYGNAAGLFAQRGLLGGKKDEDEENFSSDNEDSETEEYAGQKHLINPVLGCLDQPHPDPMEGMSEEQKEYEAMKLVQLMNNLLESRTILPCRVGPDGKPQPIEHVLQLQEGLKSLQLQSDSDTE
ncbi:synembryn-A [Sitophilus oryzae]|uniref:Synembryn-A n=1 Tax=Sitophilus oryzae TaxID=7048 RepID=A0A6J2YL40_SITOR|nr:synembryn-A [Sitophilus oryzae]XP_030763869.1 synembryn-A [Sitophilus oryzae]